MKFSEFVLSEGRKETLFDKYSDAFSLEQLDFLLNNEFIKNTNYKYADFILDRLVKFYNLTPGTEHIQDAINTVKEFDRLGKNLEKKDINQYQSLGELSLILKDYTSKSQEKKIDSDAKKIYEDGRILIVKPLSHKASCKYGAGTKWCTTQSSPGYYDKYTTGNQGLYYVIMKDFDIKNKFYKIALHKGNYNVDTWYDAEDTVMPPREVEILKVLLGKRAYKLIEDDFSENKNQELKEFFNIKNNNRVEVTNNLFNSKKPLTFEFRNPQIVSENEGFAEMDLIVYLGPVNNENRIEQGILMVAYKKQIDDSYVFDISYDPSEGFTPPVELNTLFDMDITFVLNLSNTSYPQFKKFCNLLSSQIWRRLYRDKNLEKFVLGDKKSWKPNRSSYGFTFERKGGLINKLVDYLDSGKEGSAMDFLEDSKIVRIMTNPDGTKKYIGKNGYIEPKGYFSSFFTSARNAGILSSERKNKKIILTKGPNFDDFKKGNLVPL
jgi:hypothetical protein